MARLSEGVKSVEEAQIEVDQVRRKELLEVGIDSRFRAAYSCVIFYSKRRRKNRVLVLPVAFKRVIERRRRAY
jgi:hypothetical protein